MGLHKHHPDYRDSPNGTPNLRKVSLCRLRGVTVDNFRFRGHARALNSEKAE